MKYNVLFVGSFVDKSKSGHVGGQMFASRTLINSSLKNEVNWILLDTTATKNIDYVIIYRAVKAVIRLLKFVNILFFKKVDKILIFSSHGFSIIEKGIMVLLGKLFGKIVILAPRSGAMITDVRDSGFMKWWVSLIISMANIVICQSEFWKNFYSGLLKNNDNNKLVVIQNWIDINEYKIVKRKNNTENINVLFLSWVTKEKGIFELIEAANYLKNDYPGVKYVIGGKGEDFELAKQKVSDYSMDEKFIFKGWVLGSDKKQLFADSDIYVLPTYFEGFPNSLVEGMVSGLPCIAGNVSSIPDLIEDGNNGLLVEPGNVPDLKLKLKKLYDDPDLRVRLSYNARKSIVDNNTIEIAVKKFKNLLLD